jgi:aminopeptidase N
MDDSAFEFALKCRCGMLSCTMHDPSHNTKKVVLPPVSEPVKYVLHLFCRIDEHEFDGTAAIEVDIREPGMTSLTLNAKELKVHGGSFTGVGEAYSVDLDEATSQVTYSFAMPLAVGVGTLNTTFTGQHNGDMNGFYRSSYKDVHGEEKTMVCTQFESIDARKCFPCWDEPPRKATFQCSLRVPRHMTALSNMPEASSTEHTDGTKTVRFMESPKMSTYLLAFVVGEFDFVSALTKNGVIIRVFGPPGKPNLGNFALECAVAALDMYDEAFGQPYPLPKSDMVAIPEFAAGAMENWGLVTYAGEV